MKWRHLASLLLLLCLSQADFDSRRAAAFPAFKAQFDARYMAKGTPLYQAYGGKSSCNVCHVGGSMDRERRNDYGQALDKLLDRADAEALSVENRRRNPDAARAAAKRVQEALEAVEKLPAGSHDRSPPTFGQLIREGRLPRSPTALPSTALPSP